MAKKFVRGVTDVKDIKNFDKSLTNVNDIISDGQNTYIHTKKGGNELYYKLTDRVTSIKSTGKTITVEKSDDGTVSLKTNPKKVLEHENLISNSQYVTIEHEQDTNISEIKTDNLDSKLIELDNKIPTSAGGRNLVLGTSGDWSDGCTSFNGQDNQSIDLYRIYNRGFKIGDRINIRLVLKYSDIVAAEGQTHSVLSQTEGNVTHWDGGQLDTGGRFYFDGTDGEIELKGTTVVNEDILKNDYWYWDLRVDYVESGRIQWKEAKVEVGDLPTPWSPATEDTQQQFNSLNSSLAQKQDKLLSNASIGIVGSTMRQLYALNQTYTHANGILKTHVKSVSVNSNLNVAEEEFNFTLKINQGSQDVTFTLNEHDKTKFNNIITAYGANSSVRINGCLFTLSNSTLTVTTDGNTGSNLVITFSDII